MGYAITAPQKGQTGWKEIRMINLSTGDEVKSIYKSDDQPEILNARTGKAVEKKQIDANMINGRKVVNLDQAITPATGTYKVSTFDSTGAKRSALLTPAISTAIFKSTGAIQADKPFATNSAAIAYDKKHERLYYTPMYINELRYIDLRSSKIYYYENEPFGKASYATPAGNQITRMVMASDGNGYALSNDGNHLIRFSTNKKAEITDLGAIDDDGSNKISVHSPAGYGGDMVADKSNNLYLITANRSVFKISIDAKTAVYLGMINGLPKGFSTNGALVEDGTNIIVCSSESVVGYYRFDLANLQAAAEKVSSNANVFNASDLANGNLISSKSKNKKSDTTVTKPVEQVTERQLPAAEIAGNGIVVYPNPVTDGIVKLQLNNQPAGRYQVELLDLSGKLISMKEINVYNKSQIEEFRFPELSVKGNYLIRVSSETNKVSSVNKLVVQ